jgi:hypothetical protein
MSSLFLVSHLDFARAFEGNPERATPESIAHWLEHNWLRRRGGGVWNYTPAMDVLVLAFQGLISLEQAVAHCHAYWHPHGRIENEYVVRCFWSFAREHASKIYKRKSLAAPVGRWQGRNIYIGIKAPLIRVTGKDVLAVMPIFRKTHVPNEVETNLSLTAVQEFCMREGYRDIGTELLRAQGLDKTLERQLIVDRGSDRRLYSSEEFDSFSGKYARAVALLANSGLGLQRPNFRGYRVWDPDQPPFPP